MSRQEEMWLCPECEVWIGWKRGRCNSEGHPEPIFEIRQGDVPDLGGRATTYAQASVLRRLGWKLRGFFRRWSA